MAIAQDIEREVSLLPLSELKKFRAWFEKFAAATWDQQFEEDAESGKLDALAEKSASGISSAIEMKKRWGWVFELQRSNYKS